VIIIFERSKSDPVVSTTIPDCSSEIKDAYLHLLDR